MDALKIALDFRASATGNTSEIIKNVERVIDKIGHENIFSEKDHLEYKQHQKILKEEADKEAKRNQELRLIEEQKHQQQQLQVI